MVVKTLSKLSCQLSKLGTLFVIKAQTGLVVLVM